MDTNTPVNMGMVCKGWLKAQQQPKVTSVFVGPLVTQLCIALGYQARMEWTEEIMKKAAMTPLSLKDLSTLNIGRTRSVKKRAKAAKKKMPKLSKVEMEPPPPPSSSTTPQPTTPIEQTPASPANQPYSPPILSPNNSIFSESAAPSAKDQTPAQSSSLPAAPSCFTKVTDWKTMQSFQYELHLEQETFLEQRDTRHYELLEEMRKKRKVLNSLRKKCRARNTFLSLLQKLSFVRRLK
nr:hypothetical protein Iba_chr10dCG11880 [Ipomoea batatas]